MISMISMIIVCAALGAAVEENSRGGRSPFSGRSSDEEFCTKSPEYAYSMHTFPEEVGVCHLVEIVNHIGPEVTAELRAWRLFCTTTPAAGYIARKQQ